MHALACGFLGTSAAFRDQSGTRVRKSRSASERVAPLKPRSAAEAAPGETAAAPAASTAPKPAARKKPAAPQGTAAAGAAAPAPRAAQTPKPRAAAKAQAEGVAAGKATAKAPKGGSGKGPRQAGSGAKPKPLPGARAAPQQVKRPRPLDEDPPGHRCGYVAIVGKPNAGKSTLLNALVGQKLAIVTAKPQTTRHRILGILSGPGHQAVLVDTPGVLSAPRVALDAAMMRSVRTALTQADVLCAVVDTAVAAQLEDPSEGLAGLSITGAEGGPPLLVLLNKCDLLPPDEAERVRAFFAQQPGVAAALCASAATGEGVKQLETWISNALPLGRSLYPKDQVSEHPERFFVAEIVRERIFEQYRLEIPYCTTVTVLEHRERTKEGLDDKGQPVRDYIRVRVAVERESQKPILVGKGGAAIKELSTSSRLAIEDFLQRQVFLELKVEVANGWRDSEDALERFGINNPNLLV